MTTPILTVYFDGGCPLCSREIEHYRRRDHAGRLALVDIAGPGFDAAAVGLDAQQVRKTLHVRRADGSLLTGVDSFVAIWEQLPGFGRLAALAAQPLVAPLLRGGYRLFAAVRPLLPRRKEQDCNDGSCAV